MDKRGWKVELTGENGSEPLTGRAQSGARSLKLWRTSESSSSQQRSTTRTPRTTRSSKVHYLEEIHESKSERKHVKAVLPSSDRTSCVADSCPTSAGASWRDTRTDPIVLNRSTQKQRPAPPQTAGVKQAETQAEMS